VCVFVCVCVCVCLCVFVCVCVCVLWPRVRPPRATDGGCYVCVCVREKEYV